MGSSETTSSNTSSLPFVSVVMPTYNRSAFLGRTLGPLFNQTYPADRYEIILVDDGSTDDTVARAKSLAESWQGKFRILQQQNQGPASARNAGLFVSEGDIVAFIDSDCVADSHWLTDMVHVFETTDAAGVGGGIINIAEPETWVSRYMTATNEYRHRVIKGVVDYLITPNVAFRRSIIAELGGFDVRSKTAAAEDTDLSFRLKDAGYKLIAIHNGCVTHCGVPATLAMLARTFYRYGFGSFQLSDRWRKGRSPIVEIIKHSGAVVLAPFLALATAPQVGVVRAISFWPLVVLKHGAFVTGLVVGMLNGRKMA